MKLIIPIFCLLFAIYGVAAASDGKYVFSIICLSAIVSLIYLALINNKKAEINYDRLWKAVDEGDLGTLSNQLGNLKMEDHYGSKENKGLFEIGGADYHTGGENPGIEEDQIRPKNEKG